MKNAQKVILLANVVSTVGIFATQVVCASEIVLADKEKVAPAQMDFGKSKMQESKIHDLTNITPKELTKSQDLQAKDLGKVVAKGHKDIGTQSRGRYQSSAGEISRQMLESSPSGNGDMGSILRLLPNV